MSKAKAKTESKVAKTEVQKTETKTTKPSSKRRLKAPAQTVRQAANSASTKAQTPKPARFKRLKKLGAAIAKPFVVVFAPLGKPLKKIGKWFDRQPFRFIWKIVKNIGKFFATILFINYAISAFQELQLVKWPNTKETARLTFAVIVFAIVFGVIVTVVDYGLDKIFKALILN